MGVPIGVIVAITAAAARKRKQLEIQKQINLMSQKENLSMECYNHNNSKVVGMCGSCYKAICHDCASPGCEALVCRNCKTNQGSVLVFMVLFVLFIVVGMLMLVMMSIRT